MKNQLNKTIIATALVILTMLSACTYFDKPGDATPMKLPASLKLSATGVCTFKGLLPDPACTPGEVGQTDPATICKTGYSDSVRNVSSVTHREIIVSYGVLVFKRADIQVDHLIPLELGGSNDVKNLWVQPTPYFKNKDVIENCLHKLVCEDKKLSLTEAQAGIAKDWTQYASKCDVTIGE
jgi:hypothetical protein